MAEGGSSTEVKTSGPRVTRFALISVGVVSVIQILFALGIATTFSDPSSRGAFGDMFGALNVFFSGLAFAGVIYAIVLQSEELALQRQELNLTRGELKNSADSQATLARIQARQDSRQRLRNLSAAAAQAFAFSVEAPSGEPDVSKRIVGFWTSYGGDVVAALGARSSLVEAANGLFRTAAKVHGASTPLAKGAFITEYGEPHSFFEELGDALTRRVEQMQEELTNIERFIDIYMNDAGDLVVQYPEGAVPQSRH